jgi:GrpB-like predicted nucleotidyltransferase (UPF0157 family)
MGTTACVSSRVSAKREIVDSKVMAESQPETGLIGGREQRAVEIVNYDPTWPHKFAAHAGRVHAALGPAALRVEHIGSTSVPGLAAKPIVDMLVVVPDSADEEQYIPAMIAAGYELRVREPEFHEHRMFRTPGRDVHLHFYSMGAPEIERYLLFRDRLRAVAEDRELYEEVKRELAKHLWGDINDYADAKSATVERIISAARQSQLT